MKVVGNILLLLIAEIAFQLLFSSCANQGMPSGGPKDTIPPVLLRTIPRQGALNYKGNELRLTFDEYIAIDKVMDRLVVSPPLQKKPTLLMKSKTLILKFNEDLRDNVTYSVDFKNSVEDNNERNPYNNLRISFSTGAAFDSLRVAGMVKDAATLDPIENGLVVLHKNLSDSVLFNNIPDYIAKTDQRGIFCFDNIAPGTYNIFAINDANNNLKYDEGVEEIAFADSVIFPEVKFSEVLDTVARGADSLLISGYIHFLPEPVYLRRFTEKLFNQFLSSSKRETKNKCTLIFEEPVADTFGIKLIGQDSKDWYLLEPNRSMDSITVWVRDTSIANLDTLDLEVLYNQVDSTGKIYLKKDTLQLPFTDPEKEASRRRRKEKDGAEQVFIPQFNIYDNIAFTGFDLNAPIILTTPEPVKFFNLGQVRLYNEDENSKTALAISIEKDTSAWRSYILKYKWEPNTSYRLEIDSAASENIFGLTNSKVEKKFKTQKSDYYGTIPLELKNVPGQVIVQLQQGDQKEHTLKSKIIDTDGKIVFDYLAPGKYILKAIYDSNKNGKWDTGSFREHRQPEKVAYFPLVIKVRSNWEQREIWDLKINNEFPKKLFDPDAEAAKKKAMEENNKPVPERQNSGRSIGGSTRILGNQN